MLKAVNKGAMCSNLRLKNIILNILFCTTLKQVKYVLQQPPPPTHTQHHRTLTLDISTSYK